MTRVFHIGTAHAELYPGAADPEAERSARGAKGIVETWRTHF